MQQQPPDEADIPQHLEQLIAGINGTLKIERKTNGVMIHIFMPFTNKPKKSKALVKFEDRDMRFAEGFYQLIHRANPGVRINWKSSQWAAEFAKLRKDYSEDQIAQVVNFIYKSGRGEFWRPNILSASKLRKKFNTLLAQSQGQERGKSWLGDDGPGSVS